MTDPRTGPGRETLSDGAEAVPLAVLTQHTLCPLLQMFWMTVEEMDMLSLAMLPPVQLAFFLDQ